MQTNAKSQRLSPKYVFANIKVNRFFDMDWVLIRSKLPTNY